jgi:hypothetical protein
MLNISYKTKITKNEIKNHLSFTRKKIILAHANYLLELERVLETNEMAHIKSYYEN